MARSKIFNQINNWIKAMPVFLLISAIIPLKSQEQACLFDHAALHFSGTPLDQARCLLRHVKMHAYLGPLTTHLPSILDTIIGQPVGIKKSQLKKYLAQNQLKEQDIGGALSQPLSRAGDNDPDAPLARYFIIHDTSTPNYLDKPFPDNINDKDWKHNDLSRWERGEKSKAHVFINRVGESVTTVDFKTPWRSTKFEVKVLKQKGKGLCLGIELVQPRRRDPRGTPANDAIAPNPGFTPAQMDRLALVYVAASVRRGTWLTPAFHAAMDAGIPNAHDDPQNFDLTDWGKRLNRLVKNIQALNEK